MPANVYECMFLLDTNKVAGDVPGAATQLQGLLERNQAEILASRPWDERRLAYPIRGHKKGLFYLTYFKAEGKAIVNIERDLAINEMVLRHLILNVDPKLEEAMLTVGKNPHALALQSVQEVEGGDGLDAPDMMGDSRGPRRGRRDD